MIKFPNQGPTLCQKYSESRPKNRAYHCYRAVATVPVRLLFTYTVNIWPRNQTYTVASAPTVTGSVFMQRFRLFLALCVQQ